MEILFFDDFVVYASHFFVTIQDYQELFPLFLGFLQNTCAEF